MDISSAVLNPELGCTAFTVERITCTRSRSGTTFRSVTEQASPGLQFFALPRLPLPPPARPGRGFHPKKQGRSP